MIVYFGDEEGPVLVELNCHIFHDLWLNLSNYTYVLLINEAVNF